MKMKIIAFFFVIFVLSKASCDNESTLSLEEPRITLLSFASDDIYKGLDSKTFAIQLSDEYHTKGVICPEATGNFMDDLDCHSFYMCSEGKVKHLKCLPGFAFDSSQGYCCPKKDVMSCYPTPPAVTTDSTSNNTTPKPSANTNSNVILRCTADGAYAYHEDCSRYYICVNRKPIQFRCPQDTKFDENSKKCLPSEQAVCLNSSNPNIKPNWIPNGPHGPRPHSASDLTSQESKYFSFVAYHPSF